MTKSLVIVALLASLAFMGMGHSPEEGQPNPQASLQALLKKEQVRVSPSASPSPSPSPSPSLRDVVTELILDASGSMKEKIQQRTKLYQAKRVMKSFMIENQLDRMIFALRVYGLIPKNCKDSHLLYKFGEKGMDAIDDAISAIDPKGYGKTPLAYSLLEAAKDLAKFPNKPRRIIVVTDGNDTCHGDPCKVAKQLKEKFDTRVFVVGYTLDDKDRKEIQCVGDNSGGGYADANDLNSLSDALKNLMEDKNLRVKSPEPLGLSDLVEILPDGTQRPAGSFVSNLGIHAEPGKHYRVTVHLKPEFVFNDVVLKKGEHKVLVVSGKGKVSIDFGGSKLFDVSLLNDRGKPIAIFPSDTEAVVPAGSYKVKAVAEPFATAMIDDIEVSPNGSYNEKIHGFGAVQIDLPHGQKGPYGAYLFDEKKKVDIGSFLTGTPVVLPKGRFTVKSVGNALIRNIQVEGGKVVHIMLPDPGKTLVWHAKGEIVPETTEQNPEGEDQNDSGVRIYQTH